MLSVVIHLALPLFAGDLPPPPNDDLTEALAGFDDDTEPLSTRQPERFDSFMYELDGSASLSTAYNYARNSPNPGETDFRGFSHLRGRLELKLDVSLPLEWKGRINGYGYYDSIYSLRGRNEYTNEFVKANEEEIEFNEIFLRGSLTDNLDAKLGRQIVVWGKSDNIRVTDILNPLDRREPGMVDIEHLRLPVGMTRLDYYFGKWDLTTLLIHEVRFSRRPAFGSDYFSGSAAPPPEDEPPTTVGNTQYAAALSGIVGKWDVAFYLAEVFADRCHTEEDPVTLEQAQHHGKIRMAGAAASVAAGDWLLKTEVACFDGLRYSAGPDRPKTRYDVLAGVEYRGISDTVFSFEAANRHIAGFDEGMRGAPDSAQEDEFQSALRVTRDCWHENLRLRYLLRLFDADGGGGGFQRFWAEYDVTDVIKVTAGIVDYRSGDMPPYDSIGDNDRLFADFRYSF